MSSVTSSRTGGGGSIDLLSLDPESLDSVRQCAAEFLSRSRRLNVLICNAGVASLVQGRTKDEAYLGVSALALQ